MDARSNKRNKFVDKMMTSIQSNPLNALEQHIHELGMQPQRDAFLMSFLCGLSAGAGVPFSILLAGNPASGKSTVGGTVTGFLGEDFVVSAGGLNQMSAAAASRMAERLTGHCLVCDERVVDGHFDSLWRQALSDRPASRIITVQGQPLELTVQPPVSSIEAVLSEKQMSPQDRSRYLRIRMREDEQAMGTIRALNRSTATLAGRKRQWVLDECKRMWPLYLGTLRRDLFIEVPFADQIALQSNAGFEVRTEKYILRAIQALAWLCQANREVHHDPDAGDYIVAHTDDYRLVYELLLRCADDGDSDLSDHALHLFRLWKDWVLRYGNQAMPREQIHANVAHQLSTWQVYRALCELAENELAEGPRGRGIRAIWRLTDLGMATDRPNAFRSLPHPDELAGGGAKLQMSVQPGVKS